MPNVPQLSTLNATSVDILNAIRNQASTNYQDYIPVADPNQNSIREIGAIIMNYPTLQNEFLSALVNRIGMVLITNKMYRNPWAVFKRGELTLGESIEEIFVNIAKPFTYDVDTAETQVFKREIPDVRAAFHILNYKKFYKATIQEMDLRQAFLSWSGITDLIAKIVDSMYTGANYDEFQVMKYLIARHILNGRLYPVRISTFEPANMRGIVATIKGVSNNFEFPATKYNVAGVMNHSPKDRQYIIVNAEFDAAMDVEVLAAAFNMSKAEFLGQRVLIDSFGSLDTTRLASLFANDSTYTPLTSDEITALNAVPAVLLDKDWFMIFDNLQNFTENFNGQGMYWNYFYHVWKTFSASPYANSAVFVQGQPAVSSVAVTPETATVMPGQKLLLSATVTTAYFASKEVNWTITDSLNAPVDPDVATINRYGELYVAPDATPGAELTVKATSVIDNTKYDSATITVGGA